MLNAGTQTGQIKLNLRKFVKIKILIISYLYERAFC